MPSIPHQLLSFFSNIPYSVLPHFLHLIFISFLSFLVTFWLIVVSSILASRYFILLVILMTYLLPFQFLFLFIIPIHLGSRCCCYLFILPNLDFLTQTKIWLGLVHKKILNALCLTICKDLYLFHTHINHCLKKACTKQIHSYNANSIAKVKIFFDPILPTY